jgi:ribosomal protein S12 methylthiotransferase accessory factor
MNANFPMKNIESTSNSLNVLQDGPTITIEEALKRAERLVSDRVGIISQVEFVELAPDEPAVYWARSSPADVATLCGLPALNLGSATSVDPNRAIIKAVGESIERYCSAQYDKEALPFCTHNDLEFDAVPPQDFALFSDRQHQEPKFPHGTTGLNHLYWIYGA